jgi:hypothetical protein
MQNEKVKGIACLLGLLCGIVLCGESMACEVTETQLYVTDNELDAASTTDMATTICPNDTYWFRVRWHAKGGIPWPERYNDFTAQVYEDSNQIWSESNIATTTGSAHWQQEVNEVNDASFLTKGVHTIKARARRNGDGSYNEWSPWSDTCKVYVVEVDETDWDKYAPASPNLGTCPKNGGKQLFADKISESDSGGADRKKVTLKIGIDPAVQGAEVQLSWWDVDDPCATGNAIDDNDSGGTATGGDNRGTGAGLSATSGITDANGDVTVTLTVTMQPGDNFKVTASTSPGQLSQVTQRMADGVDPLPSYVEISEMVTVWRKLHVELDSMAAVATSGSEDNWVRGSIDTGSLEYNAGSDTTTVDLEQDLAACWEEGKEFHFVGGEFYTSSGTYDPLSTIDHAGDDDIVVDGNCSIGWPSPYDLKDDDDPGLLPELPDLAKCDDIFEDCYIDCVSDAPGSSQDVTFKRHVGGEETTDSYIANAAAAGSASYEADDYWVVYVLSGYQPGYGQDEDPPAETACWGATHSTNYEITVIFLETIRDGSAVPTTLKQQTVAHEIGHQVLEEGASAHTAWTIMSATLPVWGFFEKFSDDHIATIRGRTSSPGTGL